MDNGENTKMTFVQKLENYWYHYKWQTIIGIFALCTAATCVSQCSSRTEPDAMIMFAGNYKVLSETREIPVEDVMSEDYNGDGEKRVDVFQLVLVISGDNGEYEYYDPVSQTEELQRLDIEFSSGNSVVYILHPYIYSQYRNLMRPLEDVLTEVPEYALDEYGIELSELAAYESTTLNAYPADAVLCVRNMRTGDNFITRADDKEYYENNVKFFRELVEY